MEMSMAQDTADTPAAAAAPAATAQPPTPTPPPASTDANPPPAPAGGAGAAAAGAAAGSEFFDPSFVQSLLGQVRENMKTFLPSLHTPPLFAIDEFLVRKHAVRKVGLRPRPGPLSEQKLEHR